MTPGGLRVGETVGPVTVGAVAHGGHCVARWEGVVIFVRHALPEEVVTVRVTEVLSRYARGDAVSIETPSEHRVPEPCPIAAECGGCDFQHISIAHQRELKRRVLAEQLARLAGLTWTGPVEAVEPPDLGWRTRMRYHRTPDGVPGLRAHRSHAVIPLPIDGCRIAAPSIAGPKLPGQAGLREGGDVVAVAAAGGVVTFPAETATPPTITERAAGRSWRLTGDGFWQVHPAAADTLVNAVLAGVKPVPGESALDLYCGVGLFAGALVDARCQVTGVEGDKRAVAHARRNVPEARFVAGAVERALGRLPRSADVIVLDPPRAGAGRTVLQAIMARRPRVIAYVACDPAALGRDLGTLRAAGWRVGDIRAFDLFGMTHHLETVAFVLPPPGASG